jgi:hypothetical protein
MRTAVVPASELGNDWRATAHIKHQIQMTHPDLESLADIRKKRKELLKKLDALDEKERLIHRKYLKGEGDVDP